MANNKRKAISKDDKLVAVLKLLTRGDGSPLIPPELHDKDAKTILRAVKLDWDHAWPHAMGGKDDHTNIRPMAKAEHLEKTKRDVAMIAKSKRLSKAQEEFRRKMLAKVQIVDDEPEQMVSKRKRKIPSRPLPGTKASGWMHKLNGKWVRRDKE